MEKYFVLCLLVFANAGCSADDLTYMNGFDSKSSQTLSKYSWFGNVRLYSFRVPEDAVLVRWLLKVSRDSALNCGNQNVTVHLRTGAPPVINPILTDFPNSMAVSLAQNLTLTVPSGQNASVTVLYVTYPKSGDWYLAAHLPKDDGKIQQQGMPSCSYLFQPQMFVKRAAGVTILENNIPLPQTLTTTVALFRVFVPEFSSKLDVSILNCSVNSGTVCLLSVTIGSNTLKQNSTSKTNCSGFEPCFTSISIPPWNTWLLVAVETLQPNVTVNFSITAVITAGCKPLSAASNSNTSAVFQTVFGSNSDALSASISKDQGVPSVSSSDDMCMRSTTVLKEDQDVLSTRFTFPKSNLSVTSDLPTMIELDMDSSATSGGMLVLLLKLNTSALIGEFDSIRACLTPSAPVLPLNSSTSCSTGFAQGYSLSIRSSEPQQLLSIPFPEVAMWYLTLQTLCNDSVDCRNVSATVGVAASVSPCIDDCGPYGECRLLRTYSYLYAACVCKAGWQGWGCTDGSVALSFSRQLAAVLLLTLSNLFFIPPIVVALYRGFLIEAVIYLLTMFFSTFYHACDQPGVTVMCIMDYDTLQFCDFLGSVVAIWVTIVCMARLQEPIKYTLFMAGSLLISMAMQLNRKGLWNLLGPVLLSLVIMVAAWVYRGVKRHHCYPPSWRRWVLFLIPGIVSTLIGVCLYAFAQTDSNYFYIHSMWHIMVATSVVLLLPPREKNVPPWGWTHKICGYKLCKNEKKELCTVT